MEFKIIKKTKKKRTKKPYYRVEVDFMEGDADGSQSDTLEFYEDDANDMKNMSRFVMAVACCCAAYPNGRGGYDEYNGLPEYDAFFLEEEYNLDYYDFLDEGDELTEDEFHEKVHQYVNKLNPDGIFMDHPSDSSYISTSFNSYCITHVNSEGDKSQVEVTFNNDELNRIQEAREFFK